MTNAAFEAEERTFTMTSKLHIALPLALAAINAGCSDSLPEMTDQQILELLAGRSFLSSGNAPLTIPKNVEECVRLISGVDKEIYKDMPKEIAGQIKTACRKDFSERLSDPKRNPMKLTLKQIETAEFAERLTKVRADAEKTAKQFAAAARERKKAEQVQKQQAVIDQAQAKLSDIKNQLEQRLATVAQLCSGWKGEREALKQRNRRSPLLNRFPSRVCSQSFPDQARQDLSKAGRKVADMKVNVDSWIGPVEPYFGAADLQKMDEEITKMKQQIDAMKGA